MRYCLSVQASTQRVVPVFCRLSVLYLQEVCELVDVNSVPLFSLSFFFNVALPQRQDKNIKDNSDMETKIDQENNRRLSLVTKGKTTLEHEKKIISTLYKPGKKTPNCKQNVIFQDLNGKTVVTLQYRGAHWDCMWLMHRIGGDFSMGRARKLGSVMCYSTPPPPPCLLCPRHCPPCLLCSSGERAGGDAAGDHEALTIFWGCPLAREGPVCVAQLP